MPVMANFLLVHEAIGWWADCVNCRPFPLIYDVSIFVFRYLYFFNPCFSFSNNNFGNVVHRKHKVSLNMFFCIFANEAIGWLAKCVKCKPFSLIYDVCLFPQGSYLPINQKSRHLIFNCPEFYNIYGVQNLLVIWLRWEKYPSLTSKPQFSTLDLKMNWGVCIACWSSSNLQDWRRNSMIEFKMYS